MKTFFGDDGLLAVSLASFQPRAAQLQMAETIWELFQEGEVRPDGEASKLLIEAETGIGKTLAYLLPAVLSGKRIVVSTATITLQDQILNKEIPLLESILDDSIAVVCVKGRQNYLCHYRWFQYRSSPQLGLTDEEDLEAIGQWLGTTQTGDRTELEWLPDYSPLWGKLSAKPHQCLGSDCPESSLCFVNEIRRKAGQARLLIVNHHLFFSDLALRQAGFGEVLPRYQGVIFDEAHHLENIASTFFGISFSQYQVIDLVADVERQALADLTPSHADRLIASVRGLKERMESFGDLFPQARGRYPLLDLIGDSEEWYREVKHLCSGLERLAESLGEHEVNGEGWRSLRRRSEELINNLMEIALPEVVGERGKQVHWYERRERSVALSATPIHVAERLKECLYPHIDHCVLTSATLTAAGDFSYVCERLGLDTAVETLRLPSPFDYRKRTRLYVPEREFPSPADHDYLDELCERIYAILQLSRGRALVLCTSFKGMDVVAQYLEHHLPFPVLVQGRASRHALLRQFQENTESVLVAVASFWEGVDVPGESLSCVIIDKLPFEAPSDPVLQARIADIRESGGNPFFDFQVPRAVLTLRQGVGRLMRASDDSGLIAVMDNRLFSKGYGRTFRASLPPSPLIRDLRQVESFFRMVPSLNS